MTFFKANSHELTSYINKLNIKSQTQLTLQTVKKLKINEENLIIPSYNTYIYFYVNDYNLKQLKSFAKYYKQTIGGNKDELTLRLFSYLYYSHFVIKIQKMFRGLLMRTYNKLHGPASLNRKLCVNNCDFVTMEPINEINYYQFISYLEKDIIYGFDIVSLYNMSKKTDKCLVNPYNRNEFPKSFLHNMKLIIKYCKIFYIPINLKVDDTKLVVSEDKELELRILSLFQIIDSLGNYTDPKWFNDLNISQLKTFIKELSDIWRFRAGLTIEVKKQIVYPTGDPFSRMNYDMLNIETTITFLRKVILDVLVKFVKGIDLGSKQLGAQLILCALTLVSTDAAIALPWFYESSYY
jgi:hypothetical protein